MKKAEPTIVKLFQIKSWFIPADAESYKVLKSVGLPLLKFGAEMVPTLKLVTDHRNISLVAKKFQSHLDSKLDEIGSIWLSKAGSGRKCLMNNERLTFIAPMSSRNKEAISKVEQYFTDFFARWGFYSNAEYSETASKIKLVIDYHFDRAREPIIPLVDNQTNTEAEIILGFTRIKLTFFNKETEYTKERCWKTPLTAIEVSTQAGSEWKQVLTSTFTATQVGELNSFINGISLLNSIRKIKEH